MINIKFRFINKSGAMTISDPSRERGAAGCLLWNKVRKGVWCVEFIFDDKHCLTSLKSVHEDARIMSSLVEERVLETDSNQIGIFDAKDYRNDLAAKEMPKEPYNMTRDGDKWYCAMSHITEISTSGPAAYSYGALTETTVTSFKLYARKSIDGDYIEFEIKQ
jgi:hypothetical protein